MKKYGFLAIAVFAIALICLCLPVFAAEETTQNDNQKIREIVNTIDGVGDSRAFAYGDCVLVAVRTSLLCGIRSYYLPNCSIAR